MKDADDRSVGILELTQFFGCSRTTVNNLVDEGVIVRTGRGRYLLRDSIKRYIAHLRETAAGRGGEDQVADLTAERARLAKEQADGHALKNAIARGEYIAADVITATWADTLRDVRSRLLAVPSRARSRLPHMMQSDVDAIDREIRDALTELADDDAA